MDLAVSCRWKRQFGGICRAVLRRSYCSLNIRSLRKVAQTTGTESAPVSQLCENITVRFADR